MGSEYMKWMKDFERNQKWFIENFENILKEHKEKFVAVWNQRVIDADTDLEKLSKINSILLFGEHSIKTPVFVLKHPLEEMNREERIKIFRFPSILGRDVINKFRLIFDEGMDEILLKARK